MCCRPACSTSSQSSSPELHRRATEWYAQEGEYAEAIRHAFAGKDFSRAADLVELAIPATRQNRQDVLSRRWIDEIPIEVMRMRPVLRDSFAGSRLVSGEVEGVEAALDDAERWLAASRDGTAEGMIVVDDQGFRDLPVSVAIHRAGLARLLGDGPATMAHARSALDLVGGNDMVGRAAASALLGLACWSMGDLEAAARWYEDALTGLEAAGFLSDVLGCSIALADMRRTQGRLSDAMRVLERGLALATRPGEPVLRGAADMHVGLSEILRERDDLVAASGHLAQSRGLGEENGLPQNPYRSRVAAALVREAEGDVVGALDLLDEAARRYNGDFSPDVRPVAAVRARVLIAPGAARRGMELVARSALSRPTTTLTTSTSSSTAPWRDCSSRMVSASGRMSEPRPRRAYWCACRRRPRQARGQEARSTSWPCLRSRIRPGVIRRVHFRHSSRAVELAEPEGYVRTFVDEGPMMAALLRLAAKKTDASSHIRRLLAAMDSREAPAVVSDQPLIEPLSERELEVLRLLESDLGGADIARHLTVSLPTVRTHTSNIYSKLGVSNRRAAVRRAAELGLLSRTEGRRPIP